MFSLIKLITGRDTIVIVLFNNLILKLFIIKNYYFINRVRLKKNVI